jgi:hypothetical protein
MRWIRREYLEKGERKREKEHHAELVSKPNDMGILKQVQNGKE